jgi:hypothetical protein
MPRSVCRSINHLVRVCFIAVTAGQDENLLRLVLGEDSRKSSGTRSLVRTPARARRSRQHQGLGKDRDDGAWSAAGSGGSGPAGSIWQTKGRRQPERRAGGAGSYGRGRLIGIFSERCPAAHISVIGVEWSAGAGAVARDLRPAVEIYPAPAASCSGRLWPSSPIPISDRA